MDLLQVSWEDVLFKSVLPHLSLADLFRMRAVSRDFKALVDAYFRQSRKIALKGSTPAKLNALAFKVGLSQESLERFE